MARHQEGDTSPNPAVLEALKAEGLWFYQKLLCDTLPYKRGEGKWGDERQREGEGECSLSDDSIYPFKIINR